MTTDWKQAQEIITDFFHEMKHTHYALEFVPVAENVLCCVELDKPLRIYTGSTLDLIFQDKEDHYYLYFGLGERWPKDKEGFEWLSDEHSIFFFERPYQNRVINVLKRILPDKTIEYNKNDIYIDNTKNGASLRTGQQQQIGDPYVDKNGDIVQYTASAPLSGMIYILRWDNLDGLNEIFSDSAHHQERLSNKEPLSTLSDFLSPIGVSKSDFIKMLEQE